MSKIVNSTLTVLKYNHNLLTDQMCDVQSIKIYMIYYASDLRINIYILKMLSLQVHWLPAVKSQHLTYLIIAFMM